MNKRNPVTQTQFINFYFDRFLDNAMSGKIALEYRRTLTRDDLYALENRTHWISEASLEQKLVMLSRLGYPFALVVGGAQKAPTIPAIAKMITLFFKLLAWKRKDAVQVLRDRFLFAMTDADFVKGLKMAAHLIHSPASANFAGYSSMAKGMFSYKTDLQKTTMRDIAAAHDIDGIIVSAMNMAALESEQNAFRNLYGITDRQFMILALLSKFKTCTLNELYKLTGGLKWITQNTSVLIDLKMIEKKMIQMEGNNALILKSVKTKTDYQYWLTGLGEQTLIAARNHFIKHL